MSSGEVQTPPVSCRNLWLLGRRGLEVIRVAICCYLSGASHEKSLMNSSEQQFTNILLLNCEDADEEFDESSEPVHVIGRAPQKTLSSRMFSPGPGSVLSLGQFVRVPSAVILDIPPKNKPSKGLRRESAGKPSTVS